MTLGDKLASKRKENNLTQDQLAELLDVSRQAVSKWENNTAYPETEKLIRISELFQCSLDYLLLDSKDSTTPHKEDFQKNNSASFNKQGGLLCSTSSVLSRFLFFFILVGISSNRSFMSVENWDEQFETHSFISN